MKSLHSHSLSSDPTHQTIQQSTFIHLGQSKENMTFAALKGRSAFGSRNTSHNVQHQQFFKGYNQASSI